jgi:hypothetical protein
MKYDYQCTNKKCEKYLVRESIDKPLRDADKDEKCISCGENMQKKYDQIAIGIKTNDGYKG